MVSECVFLFGLCGVLFVSLLLHTLCAMCYECAHAWFQYVVCVMCVLYVCCTCVCCVLYVCVLYVCVFVRVSGNL